jgi:hypothetical protein
VSLFLRDRLQRRTHVSSREIARPLFPTLGNEKSVASRPERPLDRPAPDASGGDRLARSAEDVLIAAFAGGTGVSSGARKVRASGGPAEEGPVPRADARAPGNSHRGVGNGRRAHAAPATAPHDRSALQLRHALPSSVTTTKGVAEQGLQGAYGVRTPLLIDGFAARCMWWCMWSSSVPCAHSLGGASPNHRSAFSLLRSLR